MRVVKYQSKYRNDLSKLFDDFHNFIISVEADFNYGPFKNHESLLQHIDKMAKESQEKNGFIFLAIVDEKPVGFIQGIVEDHSKDDIYTMVIQPRPSIQGWIGELYVDFHYRNQGISLALMKKAKSHFDSKHCTSMRLNVLYNNQVAVEFYEKFGLRKINLEMGNKLES